MWQCEQLLAAMTQGRTIDEVEENLKEAIAFILEDEKEDFRKEYKGEKIFRRKMAVL